MEFIENITGMDATAFTAMIPNMLVGCWQVIQIFLLTVLFAVPLGFLVALGRTSRFKILSGIIRIYQLIVRGTPLMLQLMFCMYAPSFLFGLTPHRFAACIIAFVINYAAYFGEIFRSGILSIDVGQMEAGRSLGLGYVDTMTQIIMPQAIKNCLPALINEIIALLKETSICGYIGLAELTRGGDIIRGVTFDPLLPLIVVAIVYLIIVMFFTWIMSLVERRLRESDIR